MKIVCCTKSLIVSNFQVVEELTQRVDLKIEVFFILFFYF